MEDYVDQLLGLEFAFVLRLGRCLTDSFIHVFDIDYGIIDQRANGNGHTTDAHSVERHAHEVEHYDRHEQCQWDGDKRDDRGSPVHQEDEKHNDHEEGTFDQSFLNIAD